METEKTVPRKVRVTCFLFLLLALACNITVLFIPFITFRKFVKPEVYTLFHTVEMLWNERIYALAVLVVGFSVLFPFFKLFVLFLVVLLKKPGPRVLALLNRVEMLAKWSMLDVFLVSLVLTLTSGQVLVSASPKGGVTLFMAAIVISMAVGQVLAGHLLDHTGRAKHFRLLKFDFKSGMRKLLVVVAGLMLFGALSFPFLKIEAWFLVDSDFSVVTVIPALWKQDSYSAAFGVGLFLVLFPVARWIGLVRRTWSGANGGDPQVHQRVFELARYWSMLDVFALALGIFLVEGSRFVPADAQLGLYLLVIVVFGNVLIERILEANPHESTKAHE